MNWIMIATVIALAIETCITVAMLIIIAAPLPMLILEESLLAYRRPAQFERAEDYFNPPHHRCKHFWRDGHFLCRYYPRRGLRNRLMLRTWAILRGGGR